jgi:hypothetical protein
MYPINRFLEIVSTLLTLTLCYGPEFELPATISHQNTIGVQFDLKARNAIINFLSPNFLLYRSLIELCSFSC